MAFRPPCRLQLSEQYNRVATPPSIARVAGTQVPHTLQRTNLSCACDLPLDEVPTPAAPDRNCCSVLINFCARRRYGNKRRIKSASRRTIMAARIKYFNSSSDCSAVRLAYHEDESMAGKLCGVRRASD